MKKISFVLLIVMGILAVSSCGSNTAPEAGTANTMKPAPSGEDIYKNNCIACHQANGTGVPPSYPPLAKADYLADHEKAITMVVKGSSSEIMVNSTKYSNYDACTATIGRRSGGGAYLYLFQFRQYRSCDHTRAGEGDTG